MKRILIPIALLLVWAGMAEAELIAAEAVRHVGDRAPIFTLVNDRGRLINYDKDYYGKHHLILTFFPAAFTPV